MLKKSFSRSLFLVAVPFVALTGVAKAKTAGEANNTEIYRKAAPGVVNISSLIVKHDFFYRPIPQEGTGSGVITPHGFSNFDDVLMQNRGINLRGWTLASFRRKMP